MLRVTALLQCTLCACAAWRWLSHSANLTTFAALAILFLLLILKHMAACGCSTEHAVLLLFTPTEAYGPTLNLTLTLTLPEGLSMRRRRGASSGQLLLSCKTGPSLGHRERRTQGWSSKCTKVRAEQDEGSRAATAEARSLKQLLLFAPRLQESLLVGTPSIFRKRKWAGLLNVRQYDQIRIILIWL